MEISTAEAEGRVNWRQVGLFVAVTFALSWLLLLALWLTTGYRSAAAGTALQLLMLLPAFSAMLLGLTIFRDRPLHHRRLQGPGRWFVFYFLAYTVAYALLATGSIALPAQAQLFALVGLALTLLGLLIVVLLRVARGRGALASIGVIGARPRYWLLFGGGFVLFYALQTLLNYLFGLGRPANMAPLAQAAGMTPETFLLVGGIQSVLISPFIGLVIAFGEEYGWRGYLQGELVKLGRARGILLVGIIWGLWHAPVIAMGHNYPGYPVIGILLMTVYTVLLAFVLGYAVLITGSIWLAAFLHALNNQSYSFLVVAVYTPDDPVLSFGAGVFGLVTLVPVVLLILRDPIWSGAQRGRPAAPKAD